MATHEWAGFARTTYEAYRANLAEQGAGDILAWDFLPKHLRTAWIAGAEAMGEQLFEIVRQELRFGIEELILALRLPPKAGT